MTSALGPLADAGRLLLAATPLGQPGDASARLIEALGTADVIAAEDTRRVRALAASLDVRPVGRVVSFFDQNEASRVAGLVESIAAGETVLVVSDAGMPLISDPGYRLVAACAEAGLPVSCLPGPSAVTTALAVSGLASDRFCFEGFAPRKGRAAWLAGFATERRTSVFFESPHRTGATLAAMAEAFGSDRRGAVCRELTKTYEEVARGTLAELVAWADGQEHGVRGEVTIVVAGAAEEEGDHTPQDLRELVAEAEADGLSRKDAIARVAAETGARRQEVYSAAHDRSLG